MGFMTPEKYIVSVVPCAIYHEPVNIIVLIEYNQF